MFSIKLYKITTFTLVICLVLALVVSSEANSHAGVVRRDHEALNRMMRKRAPAPQDNGGTANSATAAVDSTTATTSTQSTTQTQDQTQSTSSSTTSSHTSTSSITSTTSTSISTPSTTSVPSTSTSSTTLTTSTSSLTSSSLSPSTTSSSTSTTSTSSTPATTSSTSSTVQTQQQQTTTQDATTATQDDTSNTSHSTITKTASVDETASAASATSSAETSGNTSTSAKTAAITALIVVASSVGGIVILWTIFRKWKLGRSSEFDKRMQPIDWQPTTGDDGGIIGHHRATSDTSSFHSGLNHSNSLSGRSYGATSESGHGHGSAEMSGELGPLPQHDFTAAASNLAPVGGYADLARGPSPQPEMQEPLARGPSMTRPVYDVSVPLHHQMGYSSQDTYDYSGGVPARY
ncbi:uncharacterized protein BT62DRAFT_927957 [Guyanagaster necrorhizus]|uniref:Mid2 domain-containing protein n=1 Tax=Guyanagaster necrorhizus TaxID=856835 RepID=A0A9P7W174_9AGAR|nr:uncharacterized protein BT62DRAFT_927957 [Guyanagaster necrorhizus MCA 3950]KAG7450684.1 hypothetical protein BT62DRAFT_927957 [Guyanagaster necrorhizus MCA 3950]